nr:MAG TPA: helix-turn-helix domain protein [Caudoviricetes sp.]
MEKDNRMTVKQAADFLDVHTNTIYDWLRDGKYKNGKR